MQTGLAPWCCLVLMMALDTSSATLLHDLNNNYLKKEEVAVSLAGYNHAVQRSKRVAGYTVGKYNCRVYSKNALANILTDRNIPWWWFHRVFPGRIVENYPGFPPHQDSHGAKLAIVGRLATDFLLEGAVQVYSKLPGRKEYQKFGTVRSALNDFYSVNPDNVRLTKLPNGAYSRFGEIGDRTILFRSRDSSGRASIEISMVEDAPTVKRITYVGNLDN